MLDLVRRRLGDFSVPQLLVMDLSPEQLKAAEELALKTLPFSMTEFSRSCILENDNTDIMYISRSTFHYAGKAGLLPLLEHIAGEMRHGEYFIHQTACFADTEEQNLINKLYSMMKTGKWYPYEHELRAALESAGFEVTSTRQPPCLQLTSSSLVRRYNISDGHLAEIYNTIPENINVFRKHKTGFTAFLHYRIFTCRKK
jgi:predicted nuclease of restriction endonuclease-like RecB superfamily